MALETDEPRIIENQQKRFIVIAMIVSIFIESIFIIYLYNIRHKEVLLYLLIFIILVDLFAVYSINITKFIIYHDCIVTNYPFNMKTVYFDTISKIEHKRIGNSAYICFYEQFKKKCIMSISPQIFSQDDIKYLLNKILSKRPGVQLDEKTQDILAR